MTAQSTHIDDPVIRSVRAGVLDPDLVAEFEHEIAARGFESTDPPVVTAVSVVHERTDGDVRLDIDEEQQIEVSVALNRMGTSRVLHSQHDLADFWAWVDRLNATYGLTADDFRADA